MSKSTLGKCCRRLRFCYKRLNKKMNAEYIHPARNFIKDETPAQVFCCWILRIFTARNFIENETPAQVFSCEFREFFQPVILIKMKLQHRCFIVNFKTFFRHFIQSLIKENYHNSRTSDAIDMKLEPVPKLDKRNKTTSKKFDDDVKLEIVMSTAKLEQYGSRSPDR